MEKQEEPGSWSTLGPWMFEANVELRVPDMYGMKTKDLEKGDTWYRITISIQYGDDNGENGLHGNLSTPWLYSLKAAARQAKLLKGMFLGWTEYSDEKDDYVPNEGIAKFDEIIDHAVERYRITVPGGL